MRLKLIFKGRSLPCSIESLNMRNSTFTLKAMNMLYTNLANSRAYGYDQYHLTGYKKNLM